MAQMAVNGARSRGRQFETSNPLNRKKNGNRNLMSLFTDSQCHSIVFTRTRISSRNNFSFLLGQADWVLGGDAELLLAVKVDSEGGDGARAPAVPLVVDLSKRVVCRPLLIVPIVLIVQFNAM